MEYREIGKTGLKISVIGLGTWQIGGPSTMAGKQIGWGEVSENTAVDILNTAYDQGINFFDCADTYGRGKSESLIGKALKDRREKIIISSKFGNRETEEKKWIKDFSAEWMIESLEGSLKRLDTDYIDLYMLHSPIPGYSLDDELVETLEKQKSLGKIRFWGISLTPNGRGMIPADQGIQFIDRAKPIDFFELRYNLLEREPEEKLFPLCREKKIGVIARVPLASGFLSGRYKEDITFPENDVRSGMSRETVKDLVQRADKLKFMEKITGKSLAQVAVKYCAQNPDVSSVIPGAKNTQQVIKNAEASNMKDFTSEELKKMYEVLPKMDLNKEDIKLDIGKSDR